MRRLQPLQIQALRFVVISKSSNWEQQLGQQRRSKHKHQGWLAEQAWAAISS
jgi:hypothetical protein